MDTSFQRADDFKCDACQGFNFRLVSPDEAVTEMNERLAKYYVDYKDSCQHKICFHCIENGSQGHAIQVKDIPCCKCKMVIEKEKKQAEEKAKYCSCEKSKEKKTQMRSEDEDAARRGFLTSKIASMFLGTYPGFNLFSELDAPEEKTCETCNKLIQV